MPKSKIKRAYYYSGDSYRGPPKQYLVFPAFLSRKERWEHSSFTCLGSIESTTPSRYPGRNKASYYAYPGSSSGWHLKRIGPFPSRREAADALVDYISQFKYGHEQLRKIRSLATVESARCWQPTQAVARRYTLQPGWPHAHNAALSRLLHKREPDDYEVLAESEDSWEVRLDWQSSKRSDLPLPGESELWSWVRGMSTEQIVITAVSRRRAA